MRRQLALMILLVVPAITGCVAGHKMKPSEFDRIHPAVRLAYDPGSQITASGVFALPVRVENFIDRIELGPECILITERSGEMQADPYIATRVYSVKDGSERPACKPTMTPENQATFYWDDREGSFRGTLPSGLRIVIDGRRLLLGWDPKDPAGLVEMAAMKEESFGTSIRAFTIPNDLLVVYSPSGPLFLIDLKAAREQPTTDPAATDPATTSPAATNPAQPSTSPAGE